MKQVELLLRDNVPHLGRCGDIVKMSPGFARNFLVPKRLAVQATEDNRRAMERRRVRLDAEDAARMAEIAATVEQLSGVTVKTALRADENGHLYGSLNAGGIVELLAGAGHGVEEKQVRLAAPIKEVGEHGVDVHVHGDQHATVTVVIEADTADA